MKNKVIVQVIFALIQDSSEEESDSPLPELSNKAKNNKAKTQPPAKVAKKAQKQDESDEDTPVQPKVKATKAPRKGSKASVEEDKSVPAKAALRKAS